MNGSSDISAPEVYGTQGIPPAASTPVSIYEMCGWVNLNGNFGLFGRLDYSGERNDNPTIAGQQ